MNLPLWMRIIYNGKHRYAIILKFGNKFSTSQTKYKLEMKATICSLIKEIYFYLLS